jgi:uncharacterized protein YcfJ
VDKSMVKGLVVGGAAMVVLTGGAVTGYKAMNEPKYAEVLRVKEVTQTVATPRQDCREVQLQKQAPVKDEHRVAGTVIGGVAGGLLGNQVGGGRGKTIATVAGAAGGAYAGNQIQKNMQEKDVVTTTETRCTTVNEKSQKLVGYDVTVRLDGKEKVVRTSYKPDGRIPVQDGQLVLAPPAAKK